MGAGGCVARRETQTLELLSVKGRVEWHIYANQLSLGAPCTSGSVQLWGVESSRRKGSLDAPGAHQMAEQERRGEEEGEMILLGSLALCFASDVRKIGAAHHWRPAHTSCSDIVINNEQLPEVAVFCLEKPLVLYHPEPSKPFCFLLSSLEGKPLEKSCQKSV